MSAPISTLSVMLAVLFVTSALEPAHAQVILAKPDNPAELGTVHWGRDVDEGFEQARADGKPVLLLFQEIPGCSTCVRFGNGPLSHPLLVDAMESEFVPVAVYNNRGGKDAEALRRYDEPAWNNPVVRFFAPDGTELVDRGDRVWDEAGIASRIVDALTKAGRAVPLYVRLAVLETHRDGVERAVFAMPCFWAGEAALGSLDGVVSTQAGWLDGREVVQVDYVPAITPWIDLLEHAERTGCASRVYAEGDERLGVARNRLGSRAKPSNAGMRDASNGDSKYYLQRSPLRDVRLSPAQATRVNADLSTGRDPLRWLSPRQQALAAAVSVENPK